MHHVSTLRFYHILELLINDDNDKTTATLSLTTQNFIII